MGQEQMHPKMWRLLAGVTARSTLYLLQKVSEDQKMFLRAGRWQALTACEQESRSRELLIKHSSVSMKILKKTPLKAMSRDMEGKKAIENSQHGFTNGTLWLMYLRAHFEEMAVWWVKEERWLFTLTSARLVTWYSCSQTGEMRT